MVGRCTDQLVFFLFRTLIVVGAVVVGTFVVVVFVVVVLAIIAVVLAHLTVSAITRHHWSGIFEAGRRIVVCF